MLDAVEPCMDQVSGELGELFRYMRKSHLCDIEASDTKLDVGFTVNLPSYHSAFLFDQPQGTYYDLKTVIHEFGHFSAFCLAPSDDFPVDVAEIHSQGLEMLFLPYAGELFGWTLFLTPSGKPTAGGRRKTPAAACGILKMNDLPLRQIRKEEQMGIRDRVTHASPPCWPPSSDRRQNGKNDAGKKPDPSSGVFPVSYTHLDVYKRQALVAL